jgi:hypothetical protein
MKNILHYINKYPDRTKQLLGIDHAQFLDLLTQAELRHNQLQAEIESQKTRVNAKGGGRKPILSIPEQICLCLFYLRQHPTFEVLGIQFGISKTEANRPVRKFTTFSAYGFEAIVCCCNTMCN